MSRVSVAEVLKMDGGKVAQCKCIQCHRTVYLQVATVLQFVMYIL